ETQRLDIALWQFRPETFIPHAIALEVSAPIQLWVQQVSEPCEDVLLNLHTDFAEDFKQYTRTIEVLDQSEALIERGRERWRQYKALGIEPTIHKIPPSK
ncbi:MAG: DNA polymerase III subunit chi, partial [Thiotrichales bacterium]|nr:DNA polymerase III subunit chi [Thiotrichales bacterium]